MTKPTKTIPLIPDKKPTDTNVPAKEKTIEKQYMFNQKLVKESELTEDNKLVLYKHLLKTYLDMPPEIQITFIINENKIIQEKMKESESKIITELPN